MKLSREVNIMYDHRHSLHMHRHNTCRLPAVLGPEAYLDGPAAGRDEGLDGGGVVSSCKLLLLSLAPSHHGDGQQLFVHPGIQLQDLHHLHIVLDHIGYPADVLLGTHSRTEGQCIFLCKKVHGCLTSTTASSLVANAVCPSCHRNSLVLRKGWGCLNSHLWMGSKWGGVKALES